MSAPKIVKRYANRKLYDTERSCYVTLEDISTMIKAGDILIASGYAEGEEDFKELASAVHAPADEEF